MAASRLSPPPPPDLLSWSPPIVLASKAFSVEAARDLRERECVCGCVSVGEWVIVYVCVRVGVSMRECVWMGGC